MRAPTVSGEELFGAAGAGSGNGLALGWLILATAAVAASALFAILIVFARVPGVGALLPGTEFYRVALTLHVTLSQWVWFMAFAAMLWSLVASRDRGGWGWLALGLAAAGAVLMAISPALGGTRPLMSNYLPVIDSPWFLGGLSLYGVAVLVSSLLALADGGIDGVRRAAGADSCADAIRLGLRLAAAAVLLALATVAATYLKMPPELAGIAFFETLFWGGGHIWQFSLTTLMLVAWVGQSRAGALPPPGRLRLMLWMGVAPLLAVPILMLTEPAGVTYFSGFTMLMQWASWQVPLWLGAELLVRHRSAGNAPATGFSLSLLLLLIGIVLGTMISGQTTLVTAHYHGTIGAVTLAFMGLSYRVLPQFGFQRPGERLATWQLRLYGYGILLMMIGLAGAGLKGAPRKMAGNVGVEISAEVLARIVMGIGGSLATLGILLFLYLVLRQIWPRSLVDRMSHG